MNQSEYKDLQKEFRKLGKAFNAIAAPRFSQPEFLEELKKALQRLPTSEAIAAAVAELRDRTAVFLDRERKARTDQFSRIEAGFIKGARGQVKTVQEYDSSWRVGPLELEVQRSQSKVRFCYNHEPVLSWKAVNDVSAVEALEQKALGSLKRCVLEKEELVEISFTAHSRIARRRALQSNQGNPNLVPILDFLREFRVELVRRELAGSKPGKKLTTGDFPLWALLYNLDVYRALGSKVPKDKRVGFQTGSQQEQSRGKGVTLNGLNADSDYRVFCYVIPAR